MLRVWFADFWPGFDYTDNFFVSILAESGLRFKVTRLLPNVVIYSCFGDNHRKYRCCKVYYTGENRRPPLDECQFAVSFDHIDDPRHLRMPIYVYHAWYMARQMGLSGGIGDVLRILTATHSEEQILAGRDRFCSFIFSNGSVERRNAFFHRLSQYRRVDSAGTWLNNTGFTVRHKAKIDLLRGYKFNIAFENESYPGYTTEKILDPMIAGALPIYWGDPVVSGDFNTGSFLNAGDFESDEDVIEAIIRADRDPEVYLSYRRQPWFVDNKPTACWDLDRMRQFFVNVADSI